MFRDGFARLFVRLAAIFVVVCAPVVALAQGEIFSDDFESGHTCTWSVTNTPDFCDGEDNDCDGEMDVGPYVCNDFLDCSPPGVCDSSMQTCDYDYSACVCIDDSDCDDQDDCTDDTCAGGWACDYEFNVSPCDDGDLCTENEICDQGNCIGELIDCDDGNFCTIDLCEEGTCSWTTLPGEHCNDGDVCTEGDLCSDQGVCGGQPVTCPPPDPGCPQGYVCIDDGGAPSCVCQ